jgi:hypothetical protein
MSFEAELRQDVHESSLAKDAGTQLSDQHLPDLVSVLARGSSARGFARFRRSCDRRSFSE